MKIKSKISSRFLTRGLSAMMGLFLAAGSAKSQTVYQWNGGTSSDWTTTTNWTAVGQGPTNGTFNARLNVNNASRSPLIYSNAQGTTIYASSGNRGIVVGSGSSGSGSLTIAGGTFSTAGSTAQDVVGNSSGNTGQLIISGGNFIGNANGLALGIGGGPHCFLTVNSGAVTIPILAVNSTDSTIALNGGTLTYSSLSVAGSGKYTNNFNGGTLKAGANSSAFLNSFTVANVQNGGAVIDSAGFNITIGQALVHSTIPGDNAVDGGLTKLSNGTLTLTGVNTYTGPTVVNQGSLVMQLPSSSSSLTLASGTTNTISPNDSVWPMFSAALTNATLAFNYGAFDGYTSAPLNMGNLSISGTVKINILGSGFTVTDITLLTYSSKSGGGSFALGSFSGGAATLIDNGSSVVLHITSLIPQLVWTGATDNNWQTNGTVDWSGSSTVYADGDGVTFDDTSAGGMVNIPGTVNPNLITMNISANTFEFTGAGTIGGSNGLAMTGTGSLTIDTTNSFTGGVSLGGGSGTSGGYIYVNNPNALGATSGSVVVAGPANTLEIGTAGGTGIAVTGNSLTISGTGVGGARGALRGAATASGTNVWAGPVTLAATGTRIGTEDGGNLTVAGPITDNGAGYLLLIRPGTGGVVTMAAPGSTYGSTETYSDPTGVFQVGANNGFGTNELLMGPGSLDLNGFNQTFGGIVDDLGVGTFINNGAGPGTLTINTGSGSFSTAATFSDGTSQLNLVKLGTGQQTLSSANLTYTGNTTIGLGTLNLTTTSPLATSITVQGGGVLSGAVTTTGSLSLNANATVNVDPTATSILTANAINATASPINIKFLSPPPVNTATLVMTAATTIAGSGANFQTVGSRTGTFYITNSGTQLMYVPGSPAALTWTGNSPLNPTYWDVGTTTNWSNGGNPDRYFNGDNVLLNDAASSFTVSIQPPTITPGSVTFSNSANNYLVIGGAIGGSASLVKNGSGNLSLATANSYTGTTWISGGTVLLFNDSTPLGSASGSPAIITNNGTVDLEGASYAGNLNLGAKVLNISGAGVSGLGAVVNNGGFMQENAVQQIVMSGNASLGGLSRWDLRGTGNTLDMGGFNLTKAGTNEVALVGTIVNNPGNIVVNNGILGVQLGINMNGDSSHTLTINSGGTLDFWQTTGDPQWTLVLNTNSTIWGENGGGGQNNWAGPVTLNGPATLLTSGVINLSGDISGTGSITNTGSSVTTLSGNTYYTGSTTVSSGSLFLSGNATLASNTVITVSSNATLDVSQIIFTNSVGQTLSGSGTINGEVTANGTIAPGGATVGTLTFNNDLAINGNLVFKLNKSLAQSNDLISVSGALSNTGAGTLILSNLGPGLVVGDTFTLFSQPVVNGNALALAAPAGVSFTNNLAVDGSITVLTAPSLVPPTLNFASTAGSLLFNWTGGGKLQVQTNSLSSGLGTNWVDYPGGGASPVSVPMDVSRGSVFFRLVQ